MESKERGKQVTNRKHERERKDEREVEKESNK